MAIDFMKLAEEIKLELRLNFEIAKMDQGASIF